MCLNVIPRLFLCVDNGSHDMDFGPIFTLFCLKILYVTHRVFDFLYSRWRFYFKQRSAATSDSFNVGPWGKGKLVFVIVKGSV